MKWILASERLPDKDIWVYTGHGYYWFYRGKFYIDTYYTAIVNPEKWLDESEQPIKESIESVMKFRAALNCLRLEAGGTIVDSLESIFDDVVEDFTIKESTEIECYKILCEMADVPQVFIDNPTFIKSRKATEEDLAWANKKIKEFESTVNKQDEDEDEYGCNGGNHDIVPILGFENAIIGEQCRQCGKVIESIYKTSQTIPTVNVDEDVLNEVMGICVKANYYLTMNHTEDFRIEMGKLKQFNISRKGQNLNVDDVEKAAIKFVEYLIKGKWWKSFYDEKVWYQWEGDTAISESFSIKELYEQYLQSLKQ